MNIYSFFSIISFVIFLEIAIYVILKNIKDKKNIIFFFTCLILSYCSICQAFLFSASTKEMCLLLFHIYSPVVFLLLCTFIHFSFFFTGNDKYLNKYTSILLYLPGIIFGVKSIISTNITKDFEFINGTWIEILSPKSFWTISYLIFYYIYFFTSLIMIFVWYLKSKLLKERIKSKFILIGFSISFLMNCFANYIQPYILIKPLIPRISTIIYLFPVFAFWYSIIKFDFLGNMPALVEKNYLWKKLSAREKTIIPLIYEGLTYKEIAYRLFISEGTLRKHIDNIFSKTGINNKTQLIAELYYEKLNNLES